MLARFIQYISDQDLFDSKDKVLLAVSGGMDSTLLCYLFAEAGFSFAIAHCNFKLRGEDSEGDTRFVQSLAEKFQVECYLTHFDTTAYAKEKKLSIQMAARNLRYEWLEEIRIKQGYHYLATAHHLNDSIETVIYNFAKGCGIRGLHGILPKKQSLIRPLLFAERTEIEQYVEQHSINYREDVSNASDKYSRNYIRHQIIPKFKTLNSAFEKSTEETIQKIKATEYLLNQSIEQYKRQILEEKGGMNYIKPQQLPKEAKSLILYEILSPWGFNGDQISMLLNQEHQSGVSFQSKTHNLLVDRDSYIIKKNTPFDRPEYDIQPDTAMVNLPNRQVHFKIIGNKPSAISRQANEALLDLDALTFPLKLRPWKPGDIFQPFGMKGKHQKIQDFLTHRKLNRFEKETVYVLESTGKICWVLGMRIDERFKITDSTEKYLQVQIQETADR